MTSENEYRNAVRYLQNLLNGGLMGARGTSPLMTAIEACELQIPKHPISKNGCRISARIAMRILAETATTATTRTRIMSAVLSVVRSSIIASKGA